jgi:hypothetical protein
MTYLEFVCRRLLGDPSGSTFICPYCEKCRLSLHWSRDGRQRWACNSTKCPGGPKGQTWGDDMDLFRDVLHLTNYSDRIDKREAFQAEYDLERSPVLFSAGSWEMSDRLKAAMADLLAYTDESAGLRIAQRALAICCDYGLSPADLAWRVGREAEHLAETGKAFDDCDHRACESIYCRMQQPDWGELAMRANRDNGDGN